MEQALVYALAAIGGIFVTTATVRWGLALPAIVMAIVGRVFSELGSFIYRRGDINLDNEQYREQHPYLSSAVIGCVRAEYLLRGATDKYADRVNPLLRVTQKPLELLDKVMIR